jgi:hypothetical protein
MTTHGSGARGWPGDDLEVPPHSLDLDSIVQVGRRQVRHRRMATVGGTAVMLAAVVAIPATVPLRSSGGSGDGSPTASSQLPILDCDIAVLPPPAEYAEPEPDAFQYVQLATMDPTGRYVIGNSYRQTSGADGSVSVGVVLWDDGRPIAPPTLRGNIEAHDVNADGVVVGGGGAGPATDAYPWVYRDGQKSRLPTPDGYDSAEARAINAAGDVVGVLAESDGRQTMVVWPADDLDNPRVLEAPPERDVIVSGITEDGLVVGGYYGNQSGDWPADTGVYLWEPDRSLVELPVPEGAYDVYGTAVRANWAIGEVLFEPEGPRPSPGPPSTDTSVSLLWDLSTRTLQPVPEIGGAPNQVSDVNAAGDLLFAAPPAVIRGGEAYALPDPVEEGAVALPDTAYTPIVDADSISDDGSTIVGETYLSDTSDPITDRIHVVMWHC